MVLDFNTTDLYLKSQKLRVPDYVIPRVGQVKASYTLAVIRQFEMMGVKVLNGSQAIGRAKDKLRSLQILAQNKLPIVRTFFLDAEQDVETAIKVVGGPPIIIKLTSGTQGVGVLIAESTRSARSILQSLLNQGQHVLVQELLAKLKAKTFAPLL